MASQAYYLSVGLTKWPPPATKKNPDLKSLQTKQPTLLILLN